MVQVGLDIVALHQDPLMTKRIQSGKFRINKELNEEWLDIQNNGPYVLNIQGRVLACMERQGLRSSPRGFRCLRKALIRANTTIPLNPGDKIRIYTGEQPPTPTRIEQERLARVLWMVQSTYLWIPEGHEVHVYFSQEDLNKGKPPLSRYIYR
ncbi:hypothetical protein COW36_00390 [bacterium (Candidatus Blackallbacteria) CG17_big_fil_post_rev_8_21_14_2_50_48_46]|uniref:Uncharacterized protein n=1 Tax=bacterium (Candidatus Blackallbacteria) CG17_big_fil_post_rev_8_21_14_2_50_48_46 TaxID=2014261 RepID=A0A2M7GAX7_9BACT|nr:MAG: hypothetical protein COW64_10780 [bacterium (Candidatus Blackallbacteria) CG18_big_fil_WC_8_21_14_2_50_49_26]PIW19331.1 MAG: hypothetical protein COW36_00390 [bacterium (Candidatus Blackallbacteria) CG17_big_fil_post_rev_8_21_14_2_50_48_46]PIW49065.1 MAG: hypothetical protein COW20_08065 [bacterium (Candidatus Blackallbacteria) CG13_big_fil_rev_8_21_14_2_50_49_14]